MMKAEGCSMRKKIWEVKYLSLLPVLKHCKKCGKKTEFICSEQFRINAQGRNLDIWLIYKCSDCNTTWNAAVYSRIAPQALNPKLLDRFYHNDKKLVKQYAMNRGFLRENGVEAGKPQYFIAGDCFSPYEYFELEIKSDHYCMIKVSSLVREKLHLSQKEYLQLIADGKIRSTPGQDLQKCKLKDGIILVFGQEQR